MCSRFSSRHCRSYERRFSLCDLRHALRYARRFSRCSGVSGFFPMAPPLLRRLWLRFLSCPIALATRFIETVLIVLPPLLVIEATVLPVPVVPGSRRWVG